MDKMTLTVSQLCGYVDDTLYNDALLSDVYIKGELTGVSLKYSYVFFSLKDEECSVECMITDAQSVSNIEELIDGETVIIHGYASFYKKNGRFRVIVDEFFPCGEGELMAKFKRLKEKLSAMGVFAEERKQKIPEYPSAIGIVTSANGAAVHDIINIASRRNLSVALKLYPASVQGDRAAEEIAAGIEFFNRKNDVDIIIVGRGGGSAEDLSAFNEERVVMAVFASQIPIVSAVGHETDFSLCDMAADMRAPTPSAAAELCVPSSEDIKERVNAYKGVIASCVFAMTARLRERLISEKKTLEAMSVGRLIDDKRKDILFDKSRIYDILLSKISETKKSIAKAKSDIELLSPYSALERGYAIIKDGKAGGGINGFKVGDNVDIILKGGELSARITEKRVKS